MELDLAALEQLIDRRISAQRARVDRLGTVAAVNDDGTVTVDVGGTVIPSQPALTSYTGRAVGDRVLVRARAGEYLVAGEIGPAVALAKETVVTVSDVAAPTGEGWREIVAGSLWAKPYALWCKGTVAAPPPVGITVERSSTAAVTYRGGVITQTSIAEQGDYTGRGLQTGLLTFGPGAWSTLAGRTPVGGTLTLHRDATRHGFTYGPVMTTVYRVLADSPPLTPPALVQPALAMELSLNQTRSLPLDAAWCQGFCNGSVTGLEIWSGNARENVQVDTATVSITTSN